MGMDAVSSPSPPVLHPQVPSDGRPFRSIHSAPIGQRLRQAGTSRSRAGQVDPQFKRMPNLTAIGAAPARRHGRTRPLFSSWPKCQRSSKARSPLPSPTTGNMGKGRTAITHIRTASVPPAVRFTPKSRFLRFRAEHFAWGNSNIGDCVAFLRGWSCRCRCGRPQAARLSENLSENLPVDRGMRSPNSGDAGVRTYGGGVRTLTALNRTILVAGFRQLADNGLCARDRRGAM